MNPRPNMYRAVALVAVLAILSGCGSMPPDRIAYNSIDAAVTGVQQGMKAFNEVYQKGGATDADRDKVLAAYAKFQVVAKAAVDLTRNLPPGQDANVTALVTVAAQDLFDILRQFGVLQRRNG